MEENKRIYEALDEMVKALRGGKLMRVWYLSKEYAEFNADTLVYKTALFFTLSTTHLSVVSVLSL